MTEAEYIACADLRTVRLINMLLRELLPEHNQAISREAYQRVAAEVSHWETSLFSVVKVKG
jgi:hypothetical protein